MKTTVAVILYLVNLNAFAALSTVYCSHAELCKMVNQIAHENKLSNVKTENLVNISGDPHEYEPSALEIKNLINAPLLLTGPNELNPWIKKIKSQRSKESKLKTISLLFNQDNLKAYPNTSAEVLSHFWLYPKVYCSFKIQLEKDLMQIGFDIKTKGTCDPKKTEEELKNVLLKINTPIILTHDALLPLLQSLSPSTSITAIKGSGHHEETSAKAVKKMYDALRAPVVIWIIETGINVPANIKSKIRKNDIVITIDTANSKSEATFSILTELTEKLKSKVASKL